MKAVSINKIATSFSYFLGELCILPDIIRNKVDKQIEKILIKTIEDAQSKLNEVSDDIKQLTDSEAEEIYNIIIPYYNKLAQKVYKYPVPNNTELGKKFNLFFQKLTQIIDEIERISDGDMFCYCLKDN
ncbi:MAG: hypothetical protein AB1304_02950 [Bacteroidota bacterium]